MLPQHPMQGGSPNLPHPTPGHTLFSRPGVLMLMAPWQWLRNDNAAWVVWGSVTAAVLLLALASGAALAWLPARVAWILTGILGSIGLLALWGNQFSALLRLDHPHAARFVPGHMHALRSAALVQWLALVAVCSGVALVATSMLGAGWRPALLATLACAAALVLAAAAVRWSVLWLFMWLPFPVLNLPGVQAAIRPLVSFLQARWLEMPWVCAGLAMLALAFTLLSLFGKADAAHARAYARRERLLKILAASAAGQKPALAAYGRWGEWLGWPLQRLAEAWLAHVTATARPHRASVMARAELVLHGAQHWTRQVGVALLVQGVLFSGFDVVVAITGGDVSKIFGSSHVGMSIGLSSLVVTALVSLPGALWLSRREQALLMLLPGMPQGAALNRALAWQQMRHFLLIWAATLPGFLVLAWLGDGITGLAFLGVALPLSAWLWSDLSRLRGPRTIGYLRAFGAHLVLGLLSLLLLRWQPAAVLPWAACVLLLSAGLLLWRWRSLGGYPQALPAGRWS